jgi:hypothetical protein
MRKKELTVLQNASKILPTLKIRVEGEVFRSLNKKKWNKAIQEITIIKNGMQCSSIPWCQQFGGMSCLHISHTRRLILLPCEWRQTFL